jgi:hypothetical protein
MIWYQCASELASRINLGACEDRAFATTPLTMSVAELKQAVDGLTVDEFRDRIPAALVSNRPVSHAPRETDLGRACRCGVKSVWAGD